MTSSVVSRVRWCVDLLVPVFLPTVCGLLASTAQRQFRSGLYFSPGLLCEGCYMYLDMSEHKCGVAFDSPLPPSPPTHPHTHTPTTRGRHVVAWRTHWSRRKAAGATSALVASTRASDGRDGPGRGLSSLLRNFPADAQGEEDGRPRRVRSPTRTEDGQDSWVAPRRARGAGGAGEGSHGRSRGCPSADAGGPSSHE